MNSSFGRVAWNNHTATWTRKPSRRLLPKSGTKTIIMPRPNIQRGDIWKADLGCLGKVRPVVVVSLPPADNERALFIVMAHTTSVWRTQYEVVISHPALVQGVFDAQQMFLLPPVKFDRKLLSPTLSSSFVGREGEGRFRFRH